MPENKTLRDEFALATLTGLYAKVGAVALPKHQPTIALICYTMADHMMTERAKPIKPPKTEKEKDEDTEFHRILDELIEGLFKK